MEERLLVFPQIGQELHHILEIPLGLNGLTYIPAPGHELIFPGGVLQDLPLLCRLHQTVINPQGHTAAVGQLGQNGLLLRAGRILPHRPDAAIGVAHNIVVCVKFHSAGGDAVKEILGADFLHLLRRVYPWFSFEHYVRSPPGSKNWAPSTSGICPPSMEASK